MGSRSDGMQLNPNHVATVAEEGPISFGRRIRQLAASRGEQVGLILAFIGSRGMDLNCLNIVVLELYK